LIIEIETPRLELRQWRDADREPFAAMNRDPAVMEFFPSLQSRATSDAAIDRWQAGLEGRGWSNWAVELRESAEFVGFTGLSEPRHALPFSPCIEIGWRYARKAWGKGLATEAARACLQVAFEQLALPEVVSFTAVHNLRSRAVMERIGMTNANQDFEHPAIAPGHPLRLHCLYRITRAQWRQGTACASLLRKIRIA
jgi:RimJ/RimL family protein N-acetyltransferase